MKLKYYTQPRLFSEVYRENEFLKLQGHMKCTIIYFDICQTSDKVISQNKVYCLKDGH